METIRSLDNLFVVHILNLKEMINQVQYFNL